MAQPYVPDPAYWTALPNGKNGERYYSCKACHPPSARLIQNCKTHERTRAHLDAVRTFDRPPTPPPLPETPNPDYALSDEALRAILVAGSSDPDQPLYPSGHHLHYSEPNFPSTYDSRPPSPNEDVDFDWDLYATEQAFQEEDSTPDKRFARDLYDKMLDFINGYIDDYDLGMHDDDDASGSSDSDNQSDSSSTNDLPQKRARAGDVDPKTAADWLPWPDRVTCTLDILMHLPRSVFSRKQLELFLWLLRVNHIRDVPTTRSTKTLHKVIQNLCGIDTLKYQGKQGHLYHVNSLAQILAQEMCNPKVRPHLYFYPEDTGGRIEETRQASKWLNEMSPDEATPMFRYAGEDFYVHEPAMLKNGSFCIPFRWYQRDGEFRAHAWGIQPKRHEDPAEDGWVVHKEQTLDISERMLLKAFPRLSQDHTDYNVPHPSRILGVHNNNSSEPPLLKWLHTNPVIGNRWRSLAKGHRALSVPLWTYCDDTSGNQSKKWNKHNSFLFTLAGLPREQVSQEYNVHFLCTSNLAPPLEMLDGVVEQIKKGQLEGIWAWDYIYKEPVLLIPTPMSLVGDNPMQSEFACHVGSQGKFFCRMCMVKGVDVEDSRAQPPRSDQSPPNSPAPSNASSASEASNAEDVAVGGETRTAPTKGKTAETMEAMVRRITDFIKVGTPRTKEWTRKSLHNCFDLAKRLHTKAKVTKAKTETGVKDTMQEYFLDKLFSSYKEVHGSDAKQEALNAAINALPDEITSPVWQLGLDPHQDTPVEVLHVVLLGFVKYFWRDLVRNRLTPQSKQTLIARLNSVNVEGLGISPLPGATLVNYAGSLVGRDFRAICQVAPFVIYDLVAPEIYDAWVALSTLIPLIWQPVIENIDQFCMTLKTEIENFLIKTVQWTCAWFSKSKFHILLHLPDHIRRLGPSILFATEAFESFNAVIRAKSIHSNRQAPSRDIALAFAQGNRIRHLISGGLFLPEDFGDRWKANPDNIRVSDWVTIGPAAKKLLASSTTPSTYMGLPKTQRQGPGFCKKDKLPPRPWTRTLSGQRLPTARGDRSPQTLCITNSQVTLQNQDVCSAGLHVIARMSSDSPLFVARVHEILQYVNSGACNEGFPDGILLQVAHLTPGAPPLPMPRLSLVNVWRFLPLSSVLCTVNVQHDCRRHQCQATGVRNVLQERVRTNTTVPVLEHRVHPDDLILNTAQMRDAVHLQTFRQPSAPLDQPTRANIILEAVARAISGRKAGISQASQGKTTSRGRGGAGRATGRATGSTEPGRGRGRGGRSRGQTFVPSSPGEGIIDFS